MTASTAPPSVSPATASLRWSPDADSKAACASRAPEPALGTPQTALDRLFSVGETGRSETDGDGEERPRRRPGRMLHQADDRLLPQRQLRYRPGRCRAACRLRADDHRLP